MTELDRPRETRVARIAEKEYERRRADAKVDLAKRARLADEELVPLMRDRLEAWREWGEALGEAEFKGRQVIDDGQSPITDAQAKERERARKLAWAVPPDEYSSYLDHDKPDELTIAGALRLIPRSHGAGDAASFPPGKFRVIYADPPWQYNDSGKINESDGYGRAERHYPTLSLKDICELVDKDGRQVTELPAENAVLFLWATSPLLVEALTVIKAWGFEYKASFIWDKVRHNFGHYNSVRHELLLVSTCGSCLPDISKLYASVVSIERSDWHSEKPSYFREMIDELYTGPRIELFARSMVDGWTTWGNEVESDQ